MKNACRLIACIIFLLVAGSSYADATCYVARITLSGTQRGMVGQILDAFQMNTGIGAPPDVSCYEIQFVFATQLVINNGTRDQVSAMRSFDGSFTYQPDSSDSRPIYISGLNLKQGDDLVLPTDPALGREKSFLNIIGTADRRVILKDSILANVRHGIFADGDGPTDIDNVTITGDTAKSGPCLSVEAPGATVRASNFSSCSEGIHIAASNTLLDDTDIHDSNTCVNSAGAGTTIREGDIYNCATEAIRIAATNAVIENIEVYNSPMCVNISGNGSVVKGSNIHNCATEAIHLAANNVRIGSTDAARYAEDKNIIHDNTVGISETTGMTGNRWAFNSLYGNTVGIQSQRVAPMLVPDPENGKALRCAKDENENITERKIQFSGAVSGGTIILYQSDTERNQGKEFLGTCTIDESGVCSLGSVNITPRLDTSECGRITIKATAIYDTTDSTKYLADAFFLVGGPVTFVAGPFEIPTSGVAQDTDDDADDDKTNSNDTGNSMTDGGNNPIDVTSLPESGGAQTLPGASGSAAVGAKCSLTTTGATLHTMALGLDLWWLILAAIVVGSLRSVRVRIRKK